MAKMHPSITVDRIVDIVTDLQTSLNSTGVCLSCGEEQEGCEPDAAEYPCEFCELRQVYGAEQILFMISP